MRFTAPGRHLFVCLILAGTLCWALGAVAGDQLALDAPISGEVPAGTVLRIGGQTLRALQISGELEKLPFKVEFSRIAGGPATTDAFRAKALDVGFCADIPPIHSTWIGIPIRIVAVELRRNPANPAYQFGIAPGANIKSFADLRGKKIAFSPGQAQGAVVLRVLKRYGLTQKDVELVELPATSDVYSNALGAHLVDAAPLGGGIALKRYLDNYGREGGKILVPDGIKDDPQNLFVRVETLQDSAKAAAIKQFLRAWARSEAWVERHPDQWAQAYYVGELGLSDADAKYLAHANGTIEIPGDWTGIIKSEQETIDFLARETGRSPFKAEEIFDRRFEKVAADAYAEAIHDDNGAVPRAGAAALNSH